VKAAEHTRLFVYDSLLTGETEHSYLESAAPLGVVETEPGFALFELQGLGALVRGGADRVRGELFGVDATTLMRIDVLRRVPLLFQRTRITLADGSVAETYLMSVEDVRGRRRLSGGDWQSRFAPRAGRAPAGPIVTWARGRSSQGGHRR